MNNTLPTLPSVQEIKMLHEKYAPNEALFELVYTHCLIVCDIADQLMKHNTRLRFDKNLVRAGALLHDIGVYRLYDGDGSKKPHVAYITHGILGDEILKNEGFPNVLRRFCSHHTGVGLTKEDVVTQNLSLPLNSYLADSNEELAVMYADKFHSKTDPPCFNTVQHYSKEIQRFGRDKLQKFESMVDQFGVPDIEVLAKKYKHTIRN